MKLGEVLRPPSTLIALVSVTIGKSPISGIVVPALDLLSYTSLPTVFAHSDDSMMDRQYPIYPYATQVQVRIGRVWRDGMICTTITYPGGRVRWYQVLIANGLEMRVHPALVRHISARRT